MATWNEELHPRAPKGQPGGGRWIESGGWEIDDDDRAEIGQYREHDPIDDRMQENVGELSALETDAIRNYAGTGASVTLNRALREDTRLDDLSNKQALTVMHLDDLMKRAKLPEDTLLYRYYGFATGSSFSNKFKEMKPGDAFVDKGYMSTSYTNRWNEENTIMILAPKGSKAIVVPEELGFENEVILARNSRLEYIGEDPADGRKYFRLSQEGVTPATEEPIKIPPREKDDPGGLKQHLQIIAAFNKQQFPDAKSPTDFMLEHGKNFPFDESSYKGRRGRVHGCFDNSGKRAIEDPDVTYVEGFVSYQGVPLEHAWLVDKKGHVIDPTIKNGKGILGYFGIPIKSSYLRKTIVRTKRWGVLGWENIQTVMKDDPKDIVADYTKGGGELGIETPYRQGVRAKEVPLKSEVVLDVKGIAEDAAFELDFDPNRISVVQDTGPIIGGFKCAGSYDTDTGIVRLYAKELAAESEVTLKGLVAHEIMHSKLARIREARKWVENPTESKVKERLYKYYNDSKVQEQLKKTGPKVSAYAKEWWERQEDTAGWRETCDETLAEMACKHYMTGKIQGPKPWVAFYKDVLKSWDELQKIDQASTR